MPTDTQAWQSKLLRFPLEVGKKKPKDHGWQQQATSDPEKTAKWLSDGFDLGIKCGLESNLLIVDEDGPGLEQLGRLAGVPLPPHPIVHTSIDPETGFQKRQHLFQHPGTNTALHNDVKFLDCLDLRTEGGLVVAPDARSIPDHNYKSQNDLAPPALPLEFIWVIEKLQSKVTAPKNTKPTSGKIVKGSRHQALNDFAFKMRKQGYSLPVITVATIQFDKENCDPPKGDQYIREKIIPGIHSVQSEVKTFPPAIVSSTTSFSLKEFKEMEPLLVVKKSNSPVLQHPTAGEIHAFRGVGKTHVALGTLNCIATGGDLGPLSAPKPMKVAYFDGESAGSDLQKTLRDLAEENENFNIIAIEEQPDYQIPSIATAEGLAWAEEAIDRIKAEVVCFDSWSTLANIGTNEEESWQTFMAWVKKMRLRGVTVFYLHHDGKTGLQRGHSKPEDLLDWVIHLKWENGYKGAEGLKCQLSFEKARRPVRECSRFNISLIEKDGKPEWAWSLPGGVRQTEKKTGRKATPPTEEQQAFLDNLTTKQEQNVSAVAKALRVSRALAERWLTEKIDKRREKLLSPEDYVDTLRPKNEDEKGE